MSGCCRKTPCHVVMAVTGFLLVVAGVLLVTLEVAEKIINKEMDKQLMLGLDSPVFDQWMDPAPPLYMQYYFFNISNPDEILKGAKPKVKQVGPFTYRLYQPRMDVAFYTNSTVSYKYNHTLVFLPNMSLHFNNFSITQLNIPIVTVNSLISKLPSALKFLVEILIGALNDEKLFVSHTVDEWLFGYEDPVLELAHKILKTVNIDFSAKFGLFYGFNNSDDGLYLADTGRNNIASANSLHKWNGQPNLTYWTSDIANMINGTDGIFMNPKVKATDRLYIYNTDVCRSLYLDFTNHTKVRGISTVRFKLPASVFANISENPYNAGFCVPAGNCYDTGVMNISPCKQGAPVIISSPHFYLAAEKFINAIDGIKPIPDQHETFLDIEPMSGAVFQAAKRLQVNINVDTNKPVISQLKDVQPGIYPVLWLNESVSLDAGTANTFKNEVLTLINVLHAFPYILIGIGSFLIILSASLILWRYHGKRKGKFVPVNGYDNDALIPPKDTDDEEDQ